MREVKKMIVDKRTILVIDYSDLKEADMIALVNELKDIIVAENKGQLILSVYNSKNFVTPKFMRHVEKLTQEVLHLIDKMAIVGLSDTQRFILKGYNLLFQKNYLAFQTQEEAIAHLLDDTPAQK